MGMGREEKIGGTDREGGEREKSKRRGEGERS